MNTHLKIESIIINIMKKMTNIMENIKKAIRNMKETIRMINIKKEKKNHIKIEKMRNFMIKLVS